MIAKIIIINDLHYPFVNWEAFKQFKNSLKELKPEYLVLNGDILDCWEISKFNKIPKYGYRLKDEIEGLKEILQELKSLSKNSKIYWLEGNHEFRMKSYLIRQAPELYDFPNFTFPFLFDLEKLKIEYKPVRDNAVKFLDNFIEIEGWRIGHFDKSLKNPGYTITNLMKDKGSYNYIQGHCHKTAMVVNRDIQGQVYYGIENGCLCELEPSYTSETNWTNAFTIIWKLNNKLVPQIIPL